MKLLDTVVLLDFLSGEEEKTQRVKEFIDEITQKGEKLFIPEEVIVELVYFLEHGYRWEREDIFNTLNALLEDESFNVELKPLVKSALSLYAQGKGTFLDCLKAVKARQMGIKEVITFNRRFKKLGLNVLNPYELKREA
ncbi:MAG: PIN domain-containing protein [Aquificae bacterium]|nr:PIN domain-containing protein [Aquificota bacterium]